MTTDPLAVLGAANSVPDPPAVAPVESLRGLSESLPAAGQACSRRSALLAAAIIAGLVAGATGLGLGLSRGARGPAWASLRRHTRLNTRAPASSKRHFSCASQRIPT